MKKLSLMLALVAAAMLPITAMAQDSTKSKTTKKRTHKSGKGDASQQSGNDSASKSDSAQSGDSASGSASGSVVGGTTSFTDEQIELNNRAIEAAAKKDYKQAELFYSALNGLGESNVAWYNIGFTQLRQNKCIEAKNSFAKVASAPKIMDEDMPPEVIAKKTEDAMKAWGEKCTATFKLSCSPAEMEVTIDGSVTAKCDETEYAVVPGKHTITGTTEKGFNTVVVDLPANMLTIAPIEVIDYEDIVNRAGITPEELQKKSTTFKAVGYTLIGVGVAAVGAGAFLDGYYYYQYKDKLDNQLNQSNNSNEKLSNDDYYKKYIYPGYALIGVGSAMAVTGIILVIYDAVSIQPQLEELSRGQTAFRPTFAPIVAPGFSGFSLSTRF